MRNLHREVVDPAKSWRARSQSPAIEELPQFDGFPYLVTRPVPALYHLTLLPCSETSPRVDEPDELCRFAGMNPAGVPRGLEQCASCKDWRGVCLDPGEKFAGMLMTVHCRCDNHNRCGRCGGVLYERRLQANYYDAVENAIGHVPGFCCLKHQCTTPR